MSEKPRSELKKLERLLKILKEHKIKEYKTDDVHIQFDHTAFLDKKDPTLLPQGVPAYEQVF